MDNYGTDNRFSNGFYEEGPRWDDFTLQDEKRARGRFSRFFLAVFIYTVVSTVTAILGEIAITLIFPDKAVDILGSTAYIWGMNVFCMYIVALPILYLFVRKMRSVPRAKSKISFTEFLSYIAIGQLFMMAGALVGNYLNAWIGSIIGREISNSTSDLIEKSPLWLIFIVVVIIGPIVEELIFRKLLMDKLGVYGDRIAIIVSAVAFGLFHGNFYQLFYAALVGLILAYLYAKTSNIWYPIILHMVMNFIGSVLPLPLMDDINRYNEILADIANELPYDAEEFARLSGIVGAYAMFEWAIAIVGLILLIKKRRSIFVSDRCEVLIPKERRASVMVFNVGAILFIVSCVISMALNIFLI